MVAIAQTARRHHSKHLQRSAQGGTSATPVVERRAWEIRDKLLPDVPAGDHDAFDSWPDGSCRRVYDAARSTDAGRHWTGWAMRNTNNHNHTVLKKSCLGLLVCTRRAETGCDVKLRPAICDRARKKQLGSRCPRSDCDGSLVVRRCRGNHGYPVTHFWRTSGSSVFFQAKGSHDHPPPDHRTTKDGVALISATSYRMSQKSRKRRQGEATGITLLKVPKREVTSPHDFRSDTITGSDVTALAGYHGDQTCHCRAVPDVAWPSDAEEVMTSSLITFWSPVTSFPVVEQPDYRQGAASPEALSTPGTIPNLPTTAPFQISYPSPDPSLSWESMDSITFFHHGDGKTRRSHPGKNPGETPQSSSNHASSSPHNQWFDSLEGVQFNWPFYSFGDQSSPDSSYLSQHSPGGIVTGHYWTSYDSYMDDVLSVMHSNAYSDSSSSPYTVA